MVVRLDATRCLPPQADIRWLGAGESKFNEIVLQYRHKEFFFLYKFISDSLKENNAGSRKYSESSNAQII